MERVIKLRVVGFARHGKFYAICLDTYNVVRGNSFEETKGKMADALTLYMRSFTEEEILSGAYLRPAPIQFRIAWALLSIVGLVNRAIFTVSSFIASYDPQSERLRLA